MAAHQTAIGGPASPTKETACRQSGRVRSSLQCSRLTATHPNVFGARGPALRGVRTKHSQKAGPFSVARLTRGEFTDGPCDRRRMGRAGAAGCSEGGRTRWGGTHSAAGVPRHGGQQSSRFCGPQVQPKQVEVKPASRGSDRGKPLDISTLPKKGPARKYGV